MKITKSEEQFLWSFLHENNLALQCLDNSKYIQAGGVEKDWSVYDGSAAAEKEYSTISGALKNIEK